VGPDINPFRPPQATGNWGNGYDIEHQATAPIWNWAAILLSLVLLLSTAYSPSLRPPRHRTGKPESVDALLSIAESQYEIVKLTIKQGSTTGAPRDEEDL